MNNIITVDGPSGVGKGTLCQLLSQHLGSAYLDSGALYRVSALAIMRGDKMDGNLASQIEVLSSMNVQFHPTADGVDVLLDDESVGKALRNETCAKAASVLAEKPEIRRALLDKQRAYARPQTAQMRPVALIADGRDMGTVVFPNAQLKLYLTAAPEVRAQRRYNQLKEKGECVNLSRLTTEIAARDERDSSRSVAPLKPASDAVIIDTESLSIEEVLNQALQLVSARFI